MSNNLELKRVNENLYKIFYNNKKIIMPINDAKVPFGLENNYNKYKLKIELKDNDTKDMIYEIENYLMDHFKITEKKFKSSIRKNKKYVDLLICNLKKYNNNIIVKIKYNSEDDYLKTIYDISKDHIGNYSVHIDSVWYYPDSDFELGMNIFVNKINIR